MFWWLIFTTQFKDWLEDRINGFKTRLNKIIITLSNSNDKNEKKPGKILGTKKAFNYHKTIM